MVYSLWKHKVLRCCAHAFAYACDSAYGAWLKAHYPYEFYVTMLKLYTEKGNKDKIVAIINEMKRYKQIKLLPGKWKQDNRDWSVDKENNTISQSLSSIKDISQQTADELFTLSQSSSAWIGTEFIKTKEKDEEGNFIFEEKSYTADLDCFTNVLRAIQMNTSVKVNQIKVLIGIGYFHQFGGNAKLMKVFDEFIDGKNKLSKKIKSFNKRLASIRDYESSLPDDFINIREQLFVENNNIGLCLSTDPNAPGNLFFIQEIDDKFGVKLMLYNVRRGTIGTVRVRKDSFGFMNLAENQCIFLDNWEKKQKYSYKEGRKTPIDGEYDVWLRKCTVANRESYQPSIL